MHATLIYPHQLFEHHPGLAKGQGNAQQVFLVEDPLFFTQYAFHAQKLCLHRASMRAYEKLLLKQGWQVRYVEAKELKSSEDIGRVLKQAGVNSVQVVEVCDDWLDQRLRAGCRRAKIELKLLDDPHFLTPRDVFASLASQKSRWHFTDFYVQQRKRLGVLLEERSRPVGGKWSFDPENRKKLPKGIDIPRVRWPKACDEVQAAQLHIQERYPHAPGDAANFVYPVTHQQAARCLCQFLDERFSLFGDYEDAISDQEPFLFHSVLTPMLNIGLLSPQQVVDAALERIDQVPMNSLEGFLRQVIGWREYMRGVYLQFGRSQRTSNYWEHQRPMPPAFYTGTTGIAPIDHVIRSVLKNAYCHHIERLMILGNFMLLCEIHPDAIYQWFMELFIDAYDWVMVPNVYGMSQYADGGKITTKPYISGSSYVLRMSNFRKGDWSPVWDALYWRFIDKHRDFFGSNPRMSVMVSQLDRMGSKLDEHRKVANQYLDALVFKL